MSDTVTIKLVTYGETAVTVNRAEYEQAKVDETLDHLLDAYASDMDEDIHIIEPAEMGGQTFDYPSGQLIDGGND